MKTFSMADAEKIKAMLRAGKTVEVEWKNGATGDMNIGTVKSVSWDGLVFTTGGCVCTEIDKLVEIREASQKGLREGIIVYKFWFRNGTYIEKRVHITGDNAGNYYTPIEKITDTFKESFLNNLNGSIAIDHFVVRVSDVIAIDVEVQ